MEATGIREPVSKPDVIRQVLQRCGIEILSKTNTNENQPHGPGEWLLRGTTDKAPLFEGKMEPKSGDYGSSGVFFADNPDGVFAHNEGMIIVMRSDAQGRSWVLSPSPEFEQIAEQAAIKYGYDRTKVNGGLSAEQEVFKNYPVYQWRRGYATFPNEVDMSIAASILVTPGFLNKSDLEKIPQPIKKKIVEINYKTA